MQIEILNKFRIIINLSDGFGFAVTWHQNETQDFAMIFAMFTIVLKII